MTCYTKKVSKGFFENFAILEIFETTKNFKFFSNFKRSKILFSTKKFFRGRLKQNKAFKLKFEMVLKKSRKKSLKKTKQTIYSDMPD